MLPLLLVSLVILFFGVVAWNKFKPTKPKSETLSKE